MTDQVLSRIDAAVLANLCGCSCGQQIPAAGPSPDFVNEKHQQAWSERRALASQPAADWYTRLRDLDVAHDPDCDPAGCPHHTWHARIVSVTVEETPMARVVRETSTLRKAIDKIRGIRP